MTRELCRSCHEMNKKEKNREIKEKGLQDGLDYLQFNFLMSGPFFKGATLMKNNIQLNNQRVIDKKYSQWRTAQVRLELMSPIYLKCSSPASFNDDFFIEEDAQDLNFVHRHIELKSLFFEC